MAALAAQAALHCLVQPHLQMTHCRQHAPPALRPYLNSQAASAQKLELNSQWPSADEDNAGLSLGQTLSAQGPKLNLKEMPKRSNVISSQNWHGLAFYAHTASREMQARHAL